MEVAHSQEATPGAASTSAEAAAGDTYTEPEPAGETRQPTLEHSSASKIAARLKALTFSSPPYVPRAKRLARHDYSHTERRLREIQKENEILVARLSKITKQKVKPVVAEPETASSQAASVASAAINRKKHASAITAENYAIFQRLQAVRPSRDTSRHALLKEHQLSLKTQPRQQAGYRKKSTNPQRP
ncbi:hypothetical protein WJX72_004196 [[Myrmecia] bisecta]|uniref:Cilia- and flagella-associated protein 97 n=1 Tax=[Myrmecia] bisecta TaxID=41462 RepID=A0AAW1P3B6_9CHLO